MKNRKEKKLKRLEDIKENEEFEGFLLYIINTFEVRRPATDIFLPFGKNEKTEEELLGFVFLEKDAKKIQAKVPSCDYKPVRLIKIRNEFFRLEKISFKKLEKGEKQNG